ncbi:MAG: HAD-IA family hydrolase [Candidatus Cohnella colombiensis]|uniref:HAD-IA family hydrolase n=1 Tax=Candidatus Cohnella colombiensis TaxID=3121368 RepID=A0AA95F6S3_9BACL|nr:MAG: HAD-IA family hydrolase [Cohnella sp.]
MIKGVLFDLDGTLLDRDQSLVAFLQNQYNRIPALHCVEMNAYIQRFIELDQKGYVWKDQVYQKLIAELNLELTWHSLLDDYVESFQNHCIGFSGLIEILDYLKDKKLKLGVITNGFGRFQMNNINGLKISHYFDVIIISEIEGLRKPDVEIFQRALNRLEIEPHESIFVGDHPINDVEASIHSGMKGIWKEDDYFDKPRCHHLSIRDLIEIKGILESELE